MTWKYRKELHAELHINKYKWAYWKAGPVTLVFKYFWLGMDKGGLTVSDLARLDQGHKHLHHGKVQNTPEHHSFRYSVSCNS